MQEERSDLCLSLHARAVSLVSHGVGCDGGHCGAASKVVVCVSGRCGATGLCSPVGVAVAAVVLLLWLYCYYSSAAVTVLLLLCCCAVLLLLL